MNTDPKHLVPGRYLGNLPYLLRRSYIIGKPGFNFKSKGEVKEAESQKPELISFPMSYH